MKDVIMKPIIAVWFSCGAASAVAAKLTLEKYSETHDVRVINNPVIEEDEDNIRFLKDCEAWLGVTIERATNPKSEHCSARAVWAKHRWMSGIKGAPCTMELKKGARQHWEKTHKAEWHVLGFTADEKKRHAKFILTERDNVLPVLIDAGVTKKDCFGILRKAGIDLPRIYKLGYPNANCIGCVKSSSPTYWNLVRKQHPEVFADRAAQSREIGCRLVEYKGDRIFLDELSPNAKGGKLKTMQIECGIFCEEI